jgi:hypothetical protein
MTRPRLRPHWLAFLCACTVPALIATSGGCSKDKPPPPPPDLPAPAATDAGVIDLGPEDAGEEDAGDAGDGGDGGRKWSGTGKPGITKSQMQACCQRIIAQGTQYGNTPEGFNLQAIGRSCMAAASTNAPEVNVIRGFLAQAKISCL